MPFLISVGFSNIEMQPQLISVTHIQLFLFHKESTSTHTGIHSHIGYLLGEENCDSLPVHSMRRGPALMPSI